MSTERRTSRYNSFPFGINTDKSLNSIKDGELGAETRNVRITKDNLVEKESGYKSVPILPSFSYSENTNILIPTTKSVFIPLFLKLKNTLDIETTKPDFEYKSYPQLVLNSLSNIVENSFFDGQMNVFNYLHNSTSQDFNISIFDVRQQEQVLSKELIRAELISFSTSNEIVQSYNDIFGEVELQVLRQFISIKNDGDDKFSVFGINHVRINPVRGIHSIRVAFEKLFETIEKRESTSLEDKAKFADQIAELLVSFSMVKNQKFLQISDEVVGLYIADDEETGGKITSFTTVENGVYKLQYYSFDDDSFTSIVKAINPYTPTVTEILSTAAGIGSFNIANPLEFEEIQQDNFVFYGPLFVQGDASPDEKKYSSASVIYSSKSDIDMKLLIGLDKTKTYTYDLKLRTQSSQYDTTLETYRTVWSAPVDFATGTLNNNEPVIRIDKSNLTGVQARFDIVIKEDGTEVESNSIPFILSSAEPTNFQEDYQNLIRCEKQADFGTRIVKFGYRNLLYISAPLNSTYMNIKIPISNMEDGERITDVREFSNGNLIIMSQSRTWKLSSVSNDISDPSSWKIELIAKNIGAAFPYSSILFKQRLFVIAENGIYSLVEDMYRENDQAYKRLDHYNSRNYEVTIEDFFNSLMKTDVINVKTDIRNNDFETTFITLDKENNTFRNYRLKWTVDGSIQRWLIDEGESKFKDNKTFDSAWDIMDTEEVGGTKSAITLNGSVVEYDENYYKHIDKTYTMAIVTKNFNFGDPFNFKKVKEIDFVLFTQKIESQNIRFEHRMGNKITTLDNTGQSNVQQDANGQIMLLNEITPEKSYTDKSEAVSIDGEFVYDKSNYDKEYFDDTNIFHSRIKILGSSKETVSGVAFYSDSDLPIRLGSIMFKIAFKSKVAGDRQYVGPQR